LSSDAFSGFGGHDSAIHNREIEEATIYLESVVISKFSLWLEDNEPGTTSDDHSLSQLMHRNGTPTLTTHCSLWLVLPLFMDGG
jgi:hypothetical protein